MKIARKDNYGAKCSDCESKEVSLSEHYRFWKQTELDKLRNEFYANHPTPHYGTVMSIVVGAMMGDSSKVKNYALLLADKIEADGDPATARRFRKAAASDFGAVIVPMGESDGR